LRERADPPLGGGGRGEIQNRENTRRPDGQDEHGVIGLADSAYRSKANEIFLAKNGSTSKIYRERPQDRPMPKHTATANARKSAIRLRV
jgi:hypothetical protein